MKKTFILALISVIVSIILSSCAGKTNIAPSSAPPEEATPTTTTSVLEDDTEQAKEPDVTADPRDEEDSIRAEIEQKFKDIEDLITDGLIDDAQMMIKNLETFDLNDAEQKRLDEIKKSLVAISD